MSVVFILFGRLFAEHGLPSADRPASMPLLREIPKLKLRVQPHPILFFPLARETLCSICSQHGLASEPSALPSAIESCLCGIDPFMFRFQKKPLFSAPDFLGFEESCSTSFMDIQVPIFLKRFSLSYVQDFSCIEYYLFHQKKQKQISTALIVSHNPGSNSLYVSKILSGNLQRAFHEIHVGRLLLSHDAPRSVRIRCAPGLFYIT